MLLLNVAGAVSPVVSSRPCCGLMQPMRTSSEKEKTASGLDEAFLMGLEAL